MITKLVQAALLVAGGLALSGCQLGQRLLPAVTVALSRRIARIAQDLLRQAAQGKALPI